MNKEQLTDAVRDFLDEKDVHYEYDAENSVLQMGFGVKSKLKNVRVVVIVRDTAYSVLTICPLNADKDNPVEMMKYLTLANYGLMNGNFELDLSDGEIRYKTYVDADGLESVPAVIIEWSLFVGMAMMDRFGDGIAALSFGFSDAETEFKKVQEKQG